MKTNRKWMILAVLLGLVASGIVAGCSPHEPPAGESQKKTLYTCGMHPQVIQDHPGNCPICGMKLTPVRQQGAAGATNSDSVITVDPVTVQNMNIRLGVVMNGPLRKTIRTAGTVEHAETGVAVVSARVGGWVDKLLVDTMGMHVHAGDVLAELNSPEFNDAQTEFIQALPFGGSSKILAVKTRLKFKTTGVSDEQMAEIENMRRKERNLRIVAPISGFVMEKSIVQGEVVEAGAKLFQINNHDTVWVQAQIYEQDLPYLQLGQEALVKLSYMPDREFRGRVTYIYPTVDEKTRTVQVRMEFHNPGYFLKPGMFATVELRAELEGSALLVPDMAVLRSGEKNTVFVALDGGKFEPRTVTLGPRGEGNMYQVMSGLTAGERVVTSGQFMLDSESQLREAIQKMQHPQAAAQAATATQPVVQPVLAAPDITAYICPMPEHVSIRYDHAGKCPLCGMTLIPVSQKTLDKIQPGGQVEYYTCPMTDNCPVPGHGNEHYDKGGKCPVCGMTLVPVMAAPVATNEMSALPALYTCPMATHADVVSDKPGDCPKCGMTLVPTGSVEHGKIAEEAWRKEHAAGAHQH